MSKAQNIDETTVGVLYIKNVMGKLATTVDERGNWPYSGVFLQESERWLYSPFPWIERWLFSQFPGVGGGGGWLWTENDSYNPLTVLPSFMTDYGLCSTSDTMGAISGTRTNPPGAHGYTLAVGFWPIFDFATCFYGPFFVFSSFSTLISNINFGTKRSESQLI